MKLISCDGCGVLLDEEKLKFPKDGVDENFDMDFSKADYDQSSKEYRVYIECPVCNERIFGAKVSF